MVFLSLCIPIFGQCRVPIVLIKIEVQDGYHMPVSDLTKDDFTVLEDGEEQQIAGFRQMNWPDEGTLQGQYEIAYYPPSDDGEFKKVRVRFRDTQHAKDQGLRLTHDPKGYYATFRD